MKHIRLYIALIILVCMALCCSITVKAFAVSEGQEAPPAPEEQETTPEPEEQPSDPAVYAYAVTITPPDGWYLNAASIRVGITGDAWAKAELQRPGVGAWEDVTGQLQGGTAKVNITANGIYRVRVTDPNGETHETEQNVECISCAISISYALSTTPRKHLPSGWTFMRRASPSSPLPTKILRNAVLPE